MVRRGTPGPGAGLYMSYGTLGQAILTSLCRSFFYLQDETVLVLARGVWGEY